MGDMFFRRDGSPYRGARPVLQWGRDYELLGNRIVRDDRTIYGERLSTAWLGIDHGVSMFGMDLLIFETALVSRDGTRIDIIARYGTEVAAIEMHERLLLFLLIPPTLRSKVAIFKRGI